MKKRTKNILIATVILAVIWFIFSKLKCNKKNEDVKKEVLKTQDDKISDASDDKFKGLVTASRDEKAQQPIIEILR